MSIAGFWSGHDCSFCILENGVPTIHAEYERYIREKEPHGDALAFMRRTLSDEEISKVTCIATCFPVRYFEKYPESFKWFQESGKQMYIMGHHQSHASHAFYSSKFENATVLTIDGGGVETNDGHETSTTIWHGKDKKLQRIHVYQPNQINIGGLWTRVTRYIFKLQNGWPYGHQAGSVMAMASMGDPALYFDDFLKMLTQDVLISSAKPSGQPVGAYVPGKDPVHPYLEPWSKIADRSEQDKFDLAAGLQAATEAVIQKLVQSAIDTNPGVRNLCIAGGVSLNSVAIGKIRGWFPDRLDEVFVPPVPYDGGLSLGAAQFSYHHALENKRIAWEDNASPYLGEIHEITGKYPGTVTLTVTQSDVIDFLEAGEIVAVYNGRSESGRRALGNRSILADPRGKDMKDKINKKVKHRQWYRPFAPSILRSEVTNWFVEDVDSPYMTHVIEFKDEAKEKVPAVVHINGTARLQTVSKNDNEWYHGLLTHWFERTGVPILLNTSFNDREPICETPEHAVNCFLGTDIDCLYFPEKGILLRKEDV